MEADLGSWQSPDISLSHLYRGTIAWTPPTAIYRAYTVHGIWINSDNLRVQNTICTENGSTTQKAIFTRITTIPENAQVAQTGDLEPVGQTKGTHNYVNPAISE